MKKSWKFLWVIVWAISLGVVVGCGRVKAGDTAALVGKVGVGSVAASEVSSGTRLVDNRVGKADSETSDGRKDVDAARSRKSRKFTICPGYLHGNVREKLVALTFDDGPSPYTLPILDILAEEQISGTFFVIGVNVLRYPDILRRAYREGHLIGNHTYQHRDLAKLDGHDASLALAQNSRIIYRRLGVYPRLYRAPYGSCNSESMRVARDLGLVSVNWSSVADDYHVQRTTAERIADEIMALVRPGAIIDLHDGGGDRHKTVDALRIIIRKLKERGYRFVSLAELIHQEPYYDSAQWRNILSRKDAREVRGLVEQNAFSVSSESKDERGCALNNDTVDGKACLDSDVKQLTETSASNKSQEQTVNLINDFADVMEHTIPQIRL